MSDTAQINPKILTWARETAGLSIEDAAEKLGFKNTAKASAADKLTALEKGDPEPSVTTLQKAASVYRRPLIAFYMSEPPARADRGEDFRMSPGAVPHRDNAVLDALVRDVRARQEMVLQVLEDEEELSPREFVSSASIRHGVKRVVASMRSTLSVEPEAQARCKGREALFNMLRLAAERAGVYALLLGDAGSHHSDISEDVFRGFALADKVAPFIVINDNDAVSARSFTLMHELAHIWIGATGISGPLRGIPTNAVERFCNEVAGEFLLPFESLKTAEALAREDDVTEVQEVIAATSERWNVSDAAVAYKFAQRGWIRQDVASELFRLYAERWGRSKQHARDTRDPDDTGPSFYVVRRHRLGGRLMSTVRRALRNETLTRTRAGQILGVGPASVGRLLTERAPA